MSNIILFDPSRFAGSLNTSKTSLIAISEDQIKDVFLPLGVEETELIEITEEISNALETLDKDYVRQNPDVAEKLLAGVSELSDFTKRFHAPYERILDALQDNPQAVKAICEMDESTSPKKVLEEIFSSSYGCQDDEDDEDDSLYYYKKAI